MEDIEKYEDFFTKIKNFQEEQKRQKQRGLNDYNMVNVVRKENAEVGMHSNVIYSLIDPNGLHYQDDLFLNLFIQEVLTDLKDDFGEIISVKAEESTFDNRRIDFTIKSSEYYIGIEMKIDAHDLKDQLSHYEEDLVKKSEKDNKQKVFIYYLTKDGKEAAIHSHNNKITYETVSFKKHILNWIEKCQAEVKNITNLNEAFENYKDIVKKITNQYQGKVMALEDYLEKKSIEDIKGILDEIDKMQESVSIGFFEKLNEYLGTIEGKVKTSNYIDIPIGEYVIRLFYTGSELIVQIGDNCDVKERFTKPISKDKRDVFLNKYNDFPNLSNKKWEKGYGERNFEKVRLQTQDNVLKEAKKFINEFSSIQRSV